MHWRHEVRVPCGCAWFRWAGLDVIAAPRSVHGVVVSGGVAELVSCGPVTKNRDVTIIIVGHEGDSTEFAVLPPGRVGEVWLSSASVAGGYWRSPTGTADAFVGPPTGFHLDRGVPAGEPNTDVATGAGMGAGVDAIAGAGSSAGASSDGTRFLRTGDYGAIVSGELFITGRIKDMIIIRGRNHYPQVCPAHRP